MSPPRTGKGAPSDERREHEREAAAEDKKAAKALRAVGLRTDEEPAFVFRPRAP